VLVNVSIALSARRSDPPTTSGPPTVADPRSASPNTDNDAWAFFQPLWDGQTGCAEGVSECPPYDAYNPYAFSTYDLLVQTALAVEAAGSYKASAWAPAMFEVGDGGEVCYTYADCLAMIREGKDVDYEGVTGPGTYTDGGVNAVTPSYIQFNEDGSFADPVLLDTEELAELAERATSPLRRSGAGATRADEVIERMQGLIFRPEVSILKRDESLRRALREIEDLRDAALPDLAARDPHELSKLHEARNMICVAEMYLRASLCRTRVQSTGRASRRPFAQNPQPVPA